MNTQTTEQPAAATTSSGPVLEIARHFHAPPETVYAAWTKKEQADQWFAPRGFTLPWSHADVRAGGAWKTCMTSPAGEDHVVGGEYRDVQPGRRLVFTHVWEEKDGPGKETVVDVTFAPESGGTLLTFHQGVFASEESRDSHRGGWNECFDKLDEYLAGK